MDSEEDLQLFAQYRENWIAILGHLVGWSREESLDWIRKWDKHVEVFGTGGVLHETPAYHVVPLLVPRLLWEKLGNSPEWTNRLGDDIDWSLTQRAKLTPYTSNDFDWEGARRDIKNILDAYDRLTKTWPEGGGQLAEST